MKLFAFIASVLLLTSCQDNEDLVIKVKNVAFTATKLQSTDGLPFTIEDSISGDHFGFRSEWEIESNMNDVGFDPVETSVRNINYVKEFKISSDQTVCGRSPGSSLNSLFNLYYSYQVEEDTLNDGEGLEYYSQFNTFDEPLRKLEFLKANTTIAPGTYNFYFRSELADGTILLDTNLNVKIK